MKKYLIYFISTGFVLFSMAAVIYAVPAIPDPYQFIQSDGTTITIKLCGDEFLNWSEDMNGNLVVFDEKKNAYCYADWTEESESPVSAGILVTDDSVPNKNIGRAMKDRIPQNAINKANENRERVRHEIDSPKKLGNSDSNASDSLRALSDTPGVADISKLQRNLLVIYVRWGDERNIEPVPLSGHQISDLIFNPDTRSVNSYFKELLGKDDNIIIPAEVLDPLDGRQGIKEIRLSGAHTNPYDDFGKMDDIVMRAYDAVDPYINFTNYDADKNGQISSAELSVCIIVHGFEASTGSRSPSVWGSAGYTGGVRDGVYTPPSCIQGAFHDDYPLTIGILCHELGHSAYGFMDTYDYGWIDGDSQGMGYWSLMASGSWGSQAYQRAGESPAYADAYNLVEYRLVIPEVITGKAENLQLNSHLDIYRIVSPFSDTQYFLTQQRRYGMSDNFDRGAFHRVGGLSANALVGGLLIYHIDETVSTRNDKNTHYRAAIVEAHGGTYHLQNAGGNYGDFGDLWGTQSQRRSFSHSSDPSSGLYSPFTEDTIPPNKNQESGISILEIEWNENSHKTTFNVKDELSYTDVFPDVNFRREILNIIGGGRTEASSVSAEDKEYFASLTSLNVAGKGISDLTGIEHFIGLNYLYCQNNQLKKLNLSRNTALIEINCAQNRIRALKVLGNHMLKRLNCSDNYIASPNSVLSWKGKGLILGSSFIFNPQKTTDDLTYEEAFPDENFMRYVINNFFGGSKTATSILSASDKRILADYSRGLRTNLITRDINDLTGLEFFTGLTILECEYLELDILDVSKNVALEQLQCYRNKLTELSVTANTKLSVFGCESNQLTSLDVSNNAELEYFYCNSNLLTELNITKNVMLTVLGCAFNQLTELDVTKNTRLSGSKIGDYYYEAGLYCIGNMITTLDLSKNVELKVLNCEINQLTKLDISNNTELLFLSCGSNQLDYLDTSNNTALTHLYCDNNNLKSLDTSNNSLLKTLYCRWNVLTDIDISNNPVLEDFECTGNRLSKLYTFNNVNLINIACNDNNITTLDVSKNTALQLLYCNNNYMDSPASVKGWREIGLVLGYSFIFYPQNERPRFLLGDVNNDGNITMADVTLTYRHVRGLENLTGSSFLAADTNKDERITMADVALIYQYVRGKINSFE